MKVVKIDDIKIIIDDEKIVEIMEMVAMDTNQEILIRNKKETIRLSKQITESYKEERKQKYLEALADNNRLYLNSVYDTLSTKDLVKMLYKKIKKRL